MNVYKKNPEIKGNISVQGKTFDDETIVVGGIWEKFADPNTFPGIPPRLVRAEFNDLTKKQQEFIKHLVPDEEKPKHLGPTTTKNFDVVDSGKAAVVKQETTKKENKPEPVKEVKLPEKPKTLDEMFSLEEFIDVFPGVTEKNAKKVLDSFATLDSIIEAGNADLRKAGITPSFYARVRKTALERKEEE